MTPNSNKKCSPTQESHFVFGSFSIRSNPSGSEWCSIVLKWGKKKIFLWGQRGSISTIMLHFVPGAYFVRWRAHNLRIARKAITVN